MNRLLFLLKLSISTAIIFGLFFFFGKVLPYYLFDWIPASEIFADAEHVFLVVDGQSLRNWCFVFGLGFFSALGLQLLVSIILTIFRSQK